VADPVPGVDELLALAGEIQDAAVLRRGCEMGYANTVHGFGPAFESEHAQLRDAYAWIVPAFHERVGPDPAGFDPTITAMANAEAVIRDEKADNVLDIATLQHDHTVLSNKDPLKNPDYSTYHDRADDAVDTLHAWTGWAALGFKDFLRTLPIVIANQVAMLRALRFAMITNKQLHEQQRRDLWNLGQAAKTALRPHNYDDGDGPSLSTVLGVAAGVLTIAAGIAEVAVPGGELVGGLTIAGGVAATAQVLAGAKGANGKDGTPFTITGYSADTYLASMVDGLVAIAAGVDEAERAIVRNLRDNNTVLTATYRDYFRPARPLPPAVPSEPVSAPNATSDLDRDWGTGY
jgi:hypothetical protein